MAMNPNYFNVGGTASTQQSSRPPQLPPRTASYHPHATAAVHAQLSSGAALDSYMSVNNATTSAAAAANRLVYPKLATCQIAAYSGAAPVTIEPSFIARLQHLIAQAPSSNNSSNGQQIQSPSSNNIAIITTTLEDEVLALVQQHRQSVQQQNEARGKRQIDKQRQLEEKLREAAVARQRADEERQCVERERLESAARAAAEADAERLRQEELELQREKEAFDERMRKLEERKQKATMSPSSVPHSSIYNLQTQSNNNSSDSISSPVSHSKSISSPSYATSSINQSPRPPAPRPPQRPPMNTGTINIAEEMRAMSPQPPDQRGLSEEHTNAIQNFAECTSVEDKAQIQEYLSLLDWDVERALRIYFGDSPSTMDGALEKARALSNNR